MYCDKRVPQKLKGKFYRTAIRPAMLYGVECWPTKIHHVQQLSVAEMRMLRWICGHTRMDRVQNDNICDHREDDTRSWGNFLVYFQMPCQLRGWGTYL